MSTRTAGIAMAGEIGVHLAVAQHRAVAAAIGQDIRGSPAPDFRSASSGSQIVAASRVPSASTIHSVGMVRTRRGKSRDSHLRSCMLAACGVEHLPDNIAKCKPAHARSHAAGAKCIPNV